jgi:hypothetical protein
MHKEQRLMEERSSGAASSVPAVPPADAVPAPADVPEVAAAAAPAAAVPASKDEEASVAGAPEGEQAEDILADTPRDLGGAPASPAASAPAPAQAKIARRQEQMSAAGDAADDAALERDPERWLSHVEDLQRAGKLKEVERSLRAFKQRYPQYPLPRAVAELWQTLEAAQANEQH